MVVFVDEHRTPHHPCDHTHVSYLVLQNVPTLSDRRTGLDPSKPVLHFQYRSRSGWNGTPTGRESSPQDLQDLTLDRGCEEELEVVTEEYIKSVTGVF